MSIFKLQKHELRMRGFTLYINNFTKEVHYSFNKKKTTTAIMMTMASKKSTTYVVHIIGYIASDKHIIMGQKSFNFGFTVH